MTEQLISFETAKLAKEKGFDWVSYTYYYNSDDYEEYPNDNIYIYRLGYNKSNKETNSNYDIDEAVSAPTQSLLQKWLREKHGVLVESTHYTANHFTFKIYERNSIIKIVKLGSVDNLYDTYEQALEKGLYAALKLIK